MSNRSILRRTKSAKLLDKVVEYADANGWHVKIANSGHLRWEKQGKRPVHTSGTPSDRNAVHAIVAQMRRVDQL